jgi:signal transduction histidine kinase
MGVIRISTALSGDWIELRVADNGTGILESIRDRIFEPFFTSKEVGKGTGQGLAMVYATVVERHGGRVTFETETGVGTTFIVKLPVAADTVTEVEA